MKQKLALGCGLVRSIPGPTADGEDPIHPGYQVGDPQPQTPAVKAPVLRS